MPDSSAPRDRGWQPSPRTMCFSVTGGRAHPQGAYAAWRRAAPGTRVLLEVTEIDGDESSWQLLATMLDATAPACCHVVCLVLHLNNAPVPPGGLWERCLATAMALQRLELFDVRNEPEAARGVPVGVRLGARRTERADLLEIEGSAVPRPFDPPAPNVRTVVFWGPGPVPLRPDALCAFAASVPCVRVVRVDGWHRHHCAALSRAFVSAETIAVVDGRTGATLCDEGLCGECGSAHAATPGCPCGHRDGDDHFVCVARSLAYGVKLTVGGRTVPRRTALGCACAPCVRAAARAWLLVAARAGVPEPVAQLVVCATRPLPFRV